MSSLGIVPVTPKFTDLIKAAEAGHGSRALKSQHLGRQRQEDGDLQANLAIGF